MTDVSHSMLSPGEIYPLLEQAVAGGRRIDVMLDISGDRALIESFFHVPREYGVLFANDRYESLMSLTPYLWQADLHDELFARLMRTPPGWGWIATGSAPPPVCMEHWRSLLEVHSPKEKRVFFRYCDGTVMGRFLPACARQEQGELLGPYAELYVAVPAREPAFLRVTHPALEQGRYGEHAETFAPRKSPWWRMTEAHLAPFADTMAPIFRKNIVLWLAEKHPDAAGAMHEKSGGLETFVEERLRQAEEWGFTVPDHQSRYVAAILYLELAKEPPDLRLMLANARKDPEHALRLLEAAAQRTRP